MFRLPQLVRLLIHNGADVHSTSSDGETVFHLAIATYEPMCLELVKSFVEADGNTAICNAQGETALHIAIKCRYTSVAELLLSHNVSLPSGILPFTLWQHSSLQLIRLLICNRADVHSTTPEGETVFHLTIAHYNEFMCLELMRSFVEADCNTTICNTQGETALRAAVKCECTSLVELLLLHNVPLPPSILPPVLLRYPPPQLVQLLMCNGAGAHSTSSEGETVLHLLFLHVIADYNSGVHAYFSNLL